MRRERNRVASSSEYSGKACSSAPGVRKKFGCEPAARTSASPSMRSPSAVCTAWATGSIAVTSASLTSTLGCSRTILRSEYAMSLGASCEVATW